MASVSTFGLIFLMSILTGNISDFLDVIPTNEYWQNKKVQVSEAAMEAELAPPGAAGDIGKLIDDLGDELPEKRDAAAQKIRAMGPAVVPQLKEALGSGNPEVAARARRLIKDVQTLGKAAEVRKLMAIRTAGEQKMMRLLPRLKELTKSEEAFVADYANAAIAAIENKPYVRAHPSGGDDALLLPESTRIVLHMKVGGKSKPITVAELMEHAKGIGGNQPAEQATAQIKQLIEQAIGIAEQTGNVRIDGITMGVSGDIGNNTGHVAILIAGKYDPKAVSETLAGLGNAQPKAFAGVAGLEFGDAGEWTAVFPSDHHAAFVGGPKQAVKPIDAVATALKTGKGPLKGVPEMAGLLAKVDMAGPMWGAVYVTENIRQAPLFKGVESVTMTSKAKGEGMSFQFDAKGQNAPAITDAVGMVNQGVAMGKNEMKRAADNVQPQMKSFLVTMSKLMETIKCSADEKDPLHATMTGELEASPISLMSGWFGMFFGVSDRAMAPQPGALPPPAPVGPQPPPPPVRVNDQ